MSAASSYMTTPSPGHAAGSVERRLAQEFAEPVHAFLQSCGHRPAPAARASSALFGLQKNLAAEPITAPSTAERAQATKCGGDGGCAQALFGVVAICGRGAVVCLACCCGHSQGCRP